MTRDLFKKEILAIVTKSPFEVEDVEVAIPAQKEHGDYATNVAFTLPKKLRKAPAQIAEDIVALLPKTNFKYSQLNGFINAKATDKVVATGLQQITADFGSNQVNSENKLLLEYVSANPTGPLHVGHGRWAAMGDTLRRVLTYVGYQIDTEFYVNDAGNQIDKLKASVAAVARGEQPPEGGYQGDYIKDLVGSSNPIKAMMDIQAQTLSNFRVKFTNWFSEKTLHEKGELELALTKLQEKELVYKKDGATWLRTSEFGDDKDRVLIKEDGKATYFLADIAYHVDKVERGYNHLINIWGADHHGYIGRIKAVFAALYPQSDYQLDFIIGQLVSLVSKGEQVKMSKRAGTMVLLSDLISEVGSDSVRYFMSTRSFDTHLEFDIDLAKQKSSDNPVYYVQYAHARICSVIKKVYKELPALRDLDLATVEGDSWEPAEKDLVMMLLRFPEELLLIANNYSIQRLPAYLEELAKAFHSFYHECKVLTADESLTVKRLLLIDRTKLVLARGLNLLGISAPESM